MEKDGCGIGEKGGEIWGLQGDRRWEQDGTPNGCAPHHALALGCDPDLRWKFFVGSNLGSCCRLLRPCSAPLSPTFSRLLRLLGHGRTRHAHAVECGGGVHFLQPEVGRIVTLRALSETARICPDYDRNEWE